MSHSLVDVDNQISTVRTELNDRINNVITNNIVNDQYGYERITGTTDWHYKLTYYFIDNADLNPLNPNILFQYLEKSYDKTEYVHAHTINSSGTFNNDITQYMTSISNKKYLLKISANILVKDSTPPIELRPVQTQSRNYVYYINFVYMDSYSHIDTPPSTPINDYRYYKLDIGWNRIDWFILHEPDDVHMFNTYFNPLKELNSTGEPLISLFNKLDTSLILQNNIFSDKLELMTGLFPETTKLFPPYQQDSNNYRVTSQINTTVFNIRQTSREVLVPPSFTDEVNIKVEISGGTVKSGEYNLSTQFSGTNGIIYLDSVEIITKSSELSLTSFVIYTKSSDYIEQILYESLESQLITLNNSYRYLDLGIEENIDVHNSQIGFRLLSTLSELPAYDIVFRFHVQRGTGTGSTTATQIQISPEDSANLNQFVISHNGAVGIGTSDPKQYALYVNNIENGSKGIYCADDITILSDIEHKSDIQIINSPIQKILNINGVTYSRKDRPNETNKHMGFIAQNVNDVVPELCDGNNGVKYSNMVALLVEGFKELVKKNDLKF